MVRFLWNGDGFLKYSGQPRPIPEDSIREVTLVEVFELEAYWESDKYQDHLPPGTFPVLFPDLAVFAWIEWTVASGGNTRSESGA
jgi:hypothetical protein